jgi:hypothetical protein
MMFLLLLAVACGPVSPQPESCADVAPDACGDWAGCVTVEAYASGSDTPEPVGCAFADDPVDFSCPPAEICIHDPAEPDTCWRSPSGCIPDGWEQGCTDGEDACFDG